MGLPKRRGMSQMEVTGRSRRNSATVRKSGHASGKF
jgi:hypothetical protein